jgi:hypothetical protein
VSVLNVVRNVWYYSVKYGLNRMRKFLFFFFFAITFGLIFISPFMQTLRTLKCAFWPFQSDQSSSLFLNAVAANQRGPGTLGDNQARSYGNTRYFI